jgi:CubicO group peptidase (beta-lactamase class C family)
MLRRTFLAQFALALRREKLDQAEQMLKDAAIAGKVAAAACGVRMGSHTSLWAVGQAQQDTVFLLASITKPMTATGVMALSDRGHLKLGDPVRKYIPEFRGGQRDRITLQHLLTHTSGLPDMLPENEDLRKCHAPLRDFVAATCKTPLLFEPGTRVKYQSMGILLASEVIERVARMPAREFLRKHVFEPLGMKNASLGLGGRKISQTAWCEVTGNDDWNWNSPYWRDLGAPWGGAHANVDDILRYLDYFLEPDPRVVRPETARAMVTNQNAGLNEPWGIGFLVNGARFGKKCSAGTFGHWGSTGTTAWADPANGLRFVLLTTRPASDSREGVLGPVADAVSEAAG